MEPEQLFNLIVNGGGTAILIWLVIEMRREAKIERQWQHELLMYLIRRDDPAFDSAIIERPRE